MCLNLYSHRIAYESRGTANVTEYCRSTSRIAFRNGERLLKVEVAAIRRPANRQCRSVGQCRCDRYFTPFDRRTINSTARNLYCIAKSSSLRRLWTGGLTRHRESMKEILIAFSAILAGELTSRPHFRPAFSLRKYFRDESDCILRHPPFSFVVVTIPLRCAFLECFLFGGARSHA